MAPAPAGFESLPPVAPSELGPVVADHLDAEGRRLKIGDGAGDLHIWLPDAEASGRLALVVPPDGVASLRFDVASRFVRRLQDHRTAFLPRALQLTAQQRARLIQLLHAYDIHEAGGGPRDVAIEVNRAKQAALPGIEWKDSAARRLANRLIHDAQALVNGGYLRLLRGK